jgi:uncharacterized protein (DUF697 family)
LIPGVGSVVGGVISAGVASTLTIAFGEAYIATLYGLTKDDPTQDTNSARNPRRIQASTNSFGKKEKLDANDHRG